MMRSISFGSSLWTQILAGEIALLVALNMPARLADGLGTSGSPPAYFRRTHPILLLVPPLRPETQSELGALFLQKKLITIFP